MIEIISESLEDKTFKIVSSDQDLFLVDEIISLDLYCKLKRAGHNIRILKKTK